MEDARHDPSRTRSRCLRKATQPLRDDLRAYARINVLYYGLIALGMVVAWIEPSIQDQLLADSGQSLEQGVLAPVADACERGDFVLAGALTFAANLVLGSILWMTLPSMVIPFVGLASGALRAFL